VPGEQALPGQGFVVVLGRVEHHLDDTLDMAIGRRESADVDAEASSDG
jgi:hypothetical protein